MNNKIFTTKQLIILIAAILTLICIWGVVAILIDRVYIDRFSLWATLVFGTGTIITSVVAVGISILSLRREENLRKQKIADDANRFILNNDKETQYIPLCLIANSYNNHHKFERKIYNEFNILNKEVKNEVLKQLNYNYELIENDFWIDKGIKLVENFIENNEIGENILYDDAKYFHKSIEYAEQICDNTSEYVRIMPNNFELIQKITFSNGKPQNSNISFDAYLATYLNAKKNNTPLYALHKDDKPIDLLISIRDLRNCSEEELCYWVMQIVLSITLRIIREAIKGKDLDILFMSHGDAAIETFEDRYLETLLELYNLEIMTKQISKLRNA